MCNITSNDVILKRAPIFVPCFVAEELAKSTVHVCNHVLVSVVGHLAMYGLIVLEQVCVDRQVCRE